MARDLLFQVILPSDPSVIEDEVVNTYAFIAPDGADGTEIQGDLDTFYDDVGKYLSPTVSRDLPPHVKVYDIEDPSPRVPIAEYDLGLLPSPSGVGALPNEVAFCMSFRGEYTSGGANARRRGRVYLGPFHTGVNAVVDNVARPSSAFLADVFGAQQALFNGVDSSSYSWAVWSRADNFLYTVVQLWMDNEWDIQRRRGRRATQRAVYPL